MKPLLERFIGGQCSFVYLCDWSLSYLVAIFLTYVLDRKLSSWIRQVANYLLAGSFFQISSEYDVLMNTGSLSLTSVTWTVKLALSSEKPPAVTLDYGINTSNILDT